ncbi:MAG: hypothetical protein LBD52_08000 [Prevotellaceae bacterium]|jgi:hypothetical protein|nr:hypothetical protein [Prevotellaceae bacterium]
MIYRLKITAVFPKDFMRVVEIKASQTLYTLHEHLQNDLGYAPDQMVVFRTLTEKGKVKKQYGLFDMGDGSIDTLTLAELKRRNELDIQYVFDLRNNRFLKIEFTGEDEASPRKAYPLTADEKGLPPDQFDARLPAEDPLIDHEE